MNRWVDGIFRESEYRVEVKSSMYNVRVYIISIYDIVFQYLKRKNK